MQTLTFENCVCFGVGLAVVYVMFRAMGVFLFVALLSLTFSVHAQTNLVLVSNDSTAPVPVVVTSPSQPDYWPATAAGFGFGLTVCGFGWVLRMAKKVSQNDY